MPAYVAGGLLYVAAGLLNPESPMLVLISAAAASFGGASALAWMTQLLRNRERYPPSSEPALGIARSWPWLVAGALTAAVLHRRPGTRNRSRCRALSAIAANVAVEQLLATRYCAARVRFISKNFVQVVPSVDISPISLQRSATDQSTT